MSTPPLRLARGTCSMVIRLRQATIEYPPRHMTMACKIMRTPPLFDTLVSREKMIAILGDRWWPQTAKQDGDNICKRFLCNICKKRNERLNVEGVSFRSRNGAPSRKGRMVNGHTTKTSNK